MSADGKSAISTPFLFVPVATIFNHSSDDLTTCLLTYAFMADGEVHYVIRAGERKYVSDDHHANSVVMRNYFKSFFSDMLSCWVKRDYIVNRLDLKSRLFISDGQERVFEIHSSGEYRNADVVIAAYEDSLTTLFSPMVDIDLPSPSAHF